VGVAQIHRDPDSYLALMNEKVPDYERLQDETAIATGTDAMRVLELGTGTGETTLRVLELHPAAVLIGVDASREMLDRARTQLPADRVELRIGRLADSLPDGPFEVVVSALTVHHLDGSGKATLFRRVAAVLSPGGRFVLGDVVVPEDRTDVATPVDRNYDTPSTVADQLRWLAAAGLQPRVVWAQGDLAVLVAERSEV
jgi:tRNA (cmo5U34)-methyltransferase